MKRSKKLYEYAAVVQSLQTRLAIDLWHNPMGLAEKDMRALRPLLVEANNALRDIEAILENKIEAETGLTESQKWANALKNLQKELK